MSRRAPSRHSLSRTKQSSTWTCLRTPCKRPLVTVALVTVSCSYHMAWACPRTRCTRPLVTEPLVAVPLTYHMARACLRSPCTRPLVTVPLSYGMIWACLITPPAPLIWCCTIQSCMVLNVLTQYPFHRWQVWRDGRQSAGESAGEEPDDPKP